MTSYAVQMQHISKSFNGVRVLEDVNFEVRKGEIHALAGGNGAGKSTLMKILLGVHAPDEGQILVDGKQVTIKSPQDARTLGIAMIFQEFSLIPTLSIAANVFLTREARDRFGLLDDSECERRTREIFSEMNVDVDPTVPVGHLSTGYRQLTEIAKALSQNARVLIMDEPTASLTKKETEALFKLMRHLKARGISIVYISHRMEEIFEISDRVTVLRDGKLVITANVEDLTMPQLIEHVVGRKMEQTFQWKERTVDRSGQPLLELRGLVAGPRVRNINLKLFKGEIVGLAGLMGSGRSELCRALFGIDPIERGDVVLKGRRVTIRRPEDAIRAGIVLIPEDRRAQGLVLGHSVKDNMLLPILDKIRNRWGLINDQAGDSLTISFMERLRIVSDSIHKTVRLLSGGNQQKVVVAKWLAMEPDVLILDEPMVGIDIGAKFELIDIIRQLADAGKGVIVVSSELAELLAVSDRIVVLRNGQVERELDRREIPSEESLHHILQGG